MVARLVAAASLAAIVVLTTANPAAANSIAPSVLLAPGVLPLAVALAIPASLLAAVLERPFVSRAGVERHALAYSLQANLVSLLLGYLLLPFSYSMMFSEVGMLWIPVALLVSIVSEGWYLQRIAMSRPARIRWGMLTAGNLISNFVLLLLPIGAQSLHRARPYLVWDMLPYQASLAWWATVASAAIFLVAFIVPLAGRCNRGNEGSPRYETLPLAAIEAELVD